MNILCLSASNTVHMQTSGISYRVCSIIKEQLIKNGVLADHITIKALTDYRFTSCMLCGDCAYDETCPYDPAFNELFTQMKLADYIIVVVPYYSIIPSKLTMILEKLNEIFYSNALKNPQYTFKQPMPEVAIIGHGGMVESEAVLNHYYQRLITPLANLFQGLGFKVVKIDQTYPNGIPFGLLSDNDIQMHPDKIFPDIHHDEKHLMDRTYPIVLDVISKMKVTR